MYETERDLVLTRSQLVAAYVRDPEHDRYADVTALATGAAEGEFRAFGGVLPAGHELYVAHPVFALDSPKTIVVDFGSEEEHALWPQRLAWARWDGAAWAPIGAAGVYGLRVRLEGVPRIPPSVVAGETGSWLRARLETSVPRGELDAAGRTFSQRSLTADAAYADDAPLRVEGPLYPFGKTAPATTFYLACERGFSKPGTAVTIEAELDSAVEVAPSEDLVLEWEYWIGTTWASLGMSLPGGESWGPSFVDDTGAFSASGRITFEVPSNWAETTPVDAGIPVRGWWLRARIVGGEYGPTRPVLTRLALGYDWEFPRITSLQVSADPSRTGLLPDAAFANDSAVDTGKDFLPFGEKPAFNDTFYFASDEAFSKTGAWITLNVQVSSPPGRTGKPPPAAPSADLTLAFEYWDPAARAWVDHGDWSDDTNRLSKNGQITILTAPTEPVEVGGELRHWLRLRITGGDYGEDVKYLPKNPAKPEEGYYIVPATFKPPSIKSLTIDYSWNVSDEQPSGVVTENEFRIARSPAVPFDPFTLPADSRPALYLGFDREGDDTGFANRATALFLSLSEPLFEAGGAGSASDADPPAVAWEYWNGAEWSRLGTEDETRNLTRRGMVAFVGPADFRRSNEFGREAFWLRARWDSGEYAVHPRVRRVLTNTVWALHANTVRLEALGSSTGEPGQTFRTAFAPVLGGQALDVRRDRGAARGRALRARVRGRRRSGHGRPGHRRAPARGLGALARGARTSGRRSRAAVTTSSTAPRASCASATAAEGSFRLRGAATSA